MKKEYFEDPVLAITRLGREKAVQIYLEDAQWRYIKDFSRRGYPTDWSWRKYLVWERQNGKCAKCGQWVEHYEGLQTHHKKYRGNGGDNSLDNLQDLCTECHEKHHIEFPEG